MAATAGIISAIGLLFVFASLIWLGGALVQKQPKRLPAMFLGGSVGILVLGASMLVISVLMSSPKATLEVTDTVPAEPLPSRAVTAQESIDTGLNYIKRELAFIEWWRCAQTEESGVLRGACAGEGFDPVVALDKVVLVIANADLSPWSTGLTSMTHTTFAYDRSTGDDGGVLVICHFSGATDFTANLASNCELEPLTVGEGLEIMAAGALMMGVQP